MPFAPCFSLLLATGLALALPVSVAVGTEYEIGGPLAGVKLDPMPTQHGEPPGYPGGAKEGQSPELLLYPGSVERFVAYWTKYCPVRSFFDQQSLLKNWVAPDLPGASRAQVESYAAPLYNSPKTSVPQRWPDKKWATVPVVRCKPGNPVFKLELGELAEGMYAVRIIGAVETAKLKPLLEPLFVRMKVNDGLNGEISEYRMRIGYVDEFFSVAEIYFHAPVKRKYQAELTIDAGSRVELLVHNITLDDVLAGTVRRAIKTRPRIAEEPPLNPDAAGTGTEATGAPAKPSVASKLNLEERLARDAAIWNGFPPLNAPAGGLAYKGSTPTAMFPPEVPFGVADKKPEEIEKEHGKWLGLYDTGWQTRFADPAMQNVFLVNKQLGLQYTIADLRAHRPLPDPYPYKDDGVGLLFPDSSDPGKGRIWCPIANEVRDRIVYYPILLVQGNLRTWEKTGEEDAARVAAMALIRYAYAFPSIDTGNHLSYLVRNPGVYGRDTRFRRRMMEGFALGHFGSYQDVILKGYEPLFDYIKDNEELAKSVGRYVPWVKTPEDVIKLIDVYLVQTTAKRILRYHYATYPTAITALASVLGDASVTDPWMEWQFSRAFYYPLACAGVQDAMITGCDRNGCNIGNGGSSYYVSGEGAMSIAETLDKFVESGGNPKYALSDPLKYPKPLAQCYWHFDMMTAGWEFVRVGDVTGPDKAVGFLWPLLERPARNGWRWSRDARFAFALKHYFGRKGESDADWAGIEKAAQQLRRAPWLDNRSRVLPMWAGILETGLQHDDYRFRRSTFVRVGHGYGHHHNDTLDLQVVAHGLPMTIEGGQRMGYSAPPDEMSRVHNVVEIDGENYRGHSWIRTLSDTEGARYLVAESRISPGRPLFRRQIALIDVDEGSGSQPLAVELQKPGSKLPRGVTTANSYVFDCFRVNGGTVHTYCFHGSPNDQFVWNVTGEQAVKSVDRDSAASLTGLAAVTNAEVYLAPFNRSVEQKFQGAAPPLLQATWTLAREGAGQGTESRLLGVNYDSNSPPKSTRLHLFNAAGATALRAQWTSKNMGYAMTSLMVQRATNQSRLESAFGAIIEPYAGQPFVTGQRAVPVATNETDALRPVALEITTANGRTDLCYADGRPDKTREWKMENGEWKVSGEFAYVSRDANGLRTATLTRGTLLQCPQVRIEVAERERWGAITRMDYPNKTFWIDQVWPARKNDGVIEVGMNLKKGGGWNDTCVTAVSVAPDGEGSRIVTELGADMMRSPVTTLEPADEKFPGETVVRCSLGTPLVQTPVVPRLWIATDERLRQQWRVALLGGNAFRFPKEPPVSMESFGPEGVLRLWEYGVGDEVRQSTGVSLRRVGDDVYALEADAAVSVSLPGKAIEISHDQKSWTAAKTEAKEGWVSLNVGVGDAWDKPLFLKVAR